MERRGSKARVLGSLGLLLALLALPALVYANSEPDLGSDSSGILLRTFLGLIVLLVMAWIGGHPKIRRFEARVGIRHVVLAGFPFLVFGLIARRPELGVVDAGVLRTLNPVFQFALGWLGFLVGFRFDLRNVDRLPEGTALAVGLETSLPFLAVLALCVPMMLWLLGEPLSTSMLRDGAVLRDGIVLATAAAMTATWAGQASRHHGPGQPADNLLARIAQLDEIAGIAGLALLSAWFRPDLRASWEIPGSAWLFVIIGIGVTMGLLTFVMVRRHGSAGEFMAITLGAVALSSGIAGFLWLSPIVISFGAGIVVANLPCQERERLLATFGQLERPIYFVFMAVVGALLDVSDWRGWALLPVFVFARLIGKWGSLFAIRRLLGVALVGRDAKRSVVAPLSILSIAVVVGMLDLYGGASMRWVVTAVVGGSIVTEILDQIAVSSSDRQEEEA